MTLGTGTQMRTGDDGSFRFDQVATGLQIVNLDLSHLPTRYLPPSRRSYRVSLRPGQRHHLDFPIRRAAAVSGRVVTHDADGTPRGVGGILVRASGTHRDVLTDDEGWFRIGGLDARPIVVEIVTWTLGDDLRLAGEPTQVVRLQPGKTAVATSFLLERTARPVLQHFRR